MRILFASNDCISLKTLQAVCASYEVVGILSGKGRAENSIARFAKERGIPLLTPLSLGEAERREIAFLGADFLLSFSISRIFGPKFLALFSGRTMNIHPSSLPNLRGPAPLQFTILEGLERSAITFQRIAPGMDEGEVYWKIPFSVLSDDDIVSLRDKVSDLSAETVVEVLRCHSSTFHAQEGKPTYSRQIKKEDGRLDFNRDDAVTAERKIRAFRIWPKSWCDFDGQPLFFESAEAADEAEGEFQSPSGAILGFDFKRRLMRVKMRHGVLLVKRLRRDKRKLVDAIDFLNGNRKVLERCPYLK